MRQILLLLLCCAFHTGYALEAPLVPDPARTPGEVLTTEVETVCAKGYAKRVRNVPEKLKAEVFRHYGVTEHQAGEYEIDHLISLQLGGSNSIRNLWPQSYQSLPLNAHLKDQLENRAHQLVCDGRLDIGQVQNEIARDWTAAYAKYVGPLPTSAPTADQATAMRGAPSGGCPDALPVKGSSNGIYHLPSGSFYRRTIRPKACFANASAAEAAGYRAAKL